MKNFQFDRAAFGPFLPNPRKTKPSVHSSRPCNAHLSARENESRHVQAPNPPATKKPLSTFPNRILAQALHPVGSSGLESVSSSGCDDNFEEGLFCAICLQIEGLRKHKGRVAQQSQTPGLHSRLEIHCAPPMQVRAFFHPAATEVTPTQTSWNHAEASLKATLTGFL